MARDIVGTLVSLFFAVVVAQYNDDPPTPLSHACGFVIDASLEGYSWFLASDIIACLTSVPFNSAVGTRFVRYYNQTLQFQSDSAFVKNPPKGYQQPPFDIFASLQTIQNRIDSGFYHNQYAFEVDLQKISLHIHDSHVVVESGILSQFSFSIPYYLIAASKDGKSLPEVYVYNETTSAVQGPAIDTIDDKPAVQWLTEYAAAQSFGMLEPNADWNQIMVSPSQLIIGSLNPLTGGGEFYEGESLQIKYKDGSSEEWSWLAYYQSPGWTGPLTTGGDFYNFFVLGLPPANYDETYDAWHKAHPKNNTTPSIINLSQPGKCPATTSWHSVNSAYPANSIMHEACLGLYTPGSLTGYYYNDIATAVLSIPTFEGYDVETFVQAVVDFTNNATKASKVIIDLQSCSGGQVDLAFFVFNHFFPNDSPFAGSRIRDHPLANELGLTLSNYFQTLRPDDDAYDTLDGDEWVVTNRINAQTGHNFTSWQDFYGPVTANGDIFSKTEQYDLNNPNSFFGFYYDDCHATKSCKQQWSAKDIVILTDGTCSSTCTLFVEMMTAIGVRTVVVGGVPQTGPMQTASGSRGARGYNSGLLDADALEAASTDYILDTGMYVNFLGLTLRDQVRKDSTVPLEFVYQPANCRIFWTLDSVHDYSKLWHTTYNAIWNDTSVCVEGSVNAQAPVVDTQPVTLKTTTAALINKGITVHDSDDTPLDAPPAAFRFCDTQVNGQFQKAGNKCRNTGECTEIVFPCSKTQSTSRFVCISTCTVKNTDTCTGTCQPDEDATANGETAAFNSDVKIGVQAQQGFCLPPTRSQKACKLYNSPGATVPT
ncbi:hypothetical protein AMS68_007663 [Peltaster fructicola]|uniref:CPAF-like PDZ domain-containing protein n=1 Tax=Peltaster fructicola TaxID=286661 RepID=A0A6H0Y5A6_9PEZI|nr:hypothetical protein AMS68_007663 [Peltaster fructicola]